jgi:hypothetical protein
MLLSLTSIITLKLYNNAVNSSSIRDQLRWNRLTAIASLMFSALFAVAWGADYVYVLFLIIGIQLAAIIVYLLYMERKILYYKLYNIDGKVYKVAVVEKSVADAHAISGVGRIYVADTMYELLPE